MDSSINTREYNTRNTEPGHAARLHISRASFNVLESAQSGLEKDSTTYVRWAVRSG